MEAFASLSFRALLQRAHHFPLIEHLLTVRGHISSLHVTLLGRGRHLMPEAGKGEVCTAYMTRAGGFQTFWGLTELKHWVGRAVC